MNIKYLIQPSLKIENHIKLAKATSAILENDGYNNYYLLLKKTEPLTGKTYLELLTDGTKDADLPYSKGYICHLMHFHHPWSHSGYLSKTSSADVTARLFTIALNNWKTGNKSTAMYHLGRALHLIQDIFIPHHAGKASRKGHGQLEQWLLENWEQFRVQSDGYYSWEKVFTSPHGKSHHVSSQNLYDWIDYGSHISINWYDTHFADRKYKESTFAELASQIVPNTLRLTAGFIVKFLSQAGV